MKTILRDRSSVPGRDWSALVPQTGARITCPSRAELIPKVQTHLKANGLPPMETPEEDIDSMICGALSSGDRSRRCVFVPEGSTPHASPTPLAAAARFIRHVLSSGWKYVTQEQADERALVCAMCPYNVPVTGCMACDAAAELVAGASQVLGEKSTSLDNRLRSCGVCGCRLTVKVWIEQEPSNDFPAWCWARKEDV